MRAAAALSLAIEDRNASCAEAANAPSDAIKATLQRRLEMTPVPAVRASGALNCGLCGNTRARSLTRERSYARARLRCQLKFTFCFANQSTLAAPAVLGAAETARSRWTGHHRPITRLRPRGFQPKCTPHPRAETGSPSRSGERRQFRTARRNQDGPRTTPVGSSWGNRKAKKLQRARHSARSAL